MNVRDLNLSYQTNRMAHFFRTLNNNRRFNQRELSGILSVNNISELKGKNEPKKNPDYEDHDAHLTLRQLMLQHIFLSRQNNESESEIMEDEFI